MPDERGPGGGRLLPWLGLIAFASGLPYALVAETAPTLYRAEGVDRTRLGLFSALTLGWPIKALIAPLVDRFGVRRRWVPVLALALGFVLLLVSGLPGHEIGAAAIALFGLVALLGGLFDVAIDGYAVDATPAERAGPAAGVRTAFYRIGFAVAAGTLVARAPALGWSGTWLVAAGLLGVVAAFTLALPPAPRTRAPDVNLLHALRALRARPAWLGMLLFVLLYKVGDRAMAPMAKPFLQDQGFTLQELGDVLTPLVILATLAGALLGGLLTRRWGVVRALLVLGLAQALSNVGYAGAAVVGGRGGAWTAALLEPFCGGLGSAPFVALFMLGCRGAYAGTQYAFLTALMGLVGGAIGIPSGAIVDHTGLGYGGFFLVTGLIAIPPLLLLPYVARWLDAARNDQAAAAAP
jgi:PAT family beta-lactamase induction signal transducer AmpG